ncbi:hypothetical protein GCM10023189_44370 [Nibrella saemangeumensis]|uniref:GRAS domain family protein n=1 Tax=Nibrella saemangeumensis TaxID=1084526 RepID=A0ABP8NBT2_9BACT
MNAMKINSLSALQTLALRMPGALTDSDRDLLEELYEQSLENLDDSANLFTYMLVTAMRRRLTGVQAAEHIYLQRFEIPQIRLFELLIQQFPLANLSQQCTNALLIDGLSRHQEPVLMDIGVGTGMQVVNILNGLAQHPTSAIRHLTIVGIEPFEDALASAQETISGLGASLPFTISFVAKQAFIEQVSLADLQQSLPSRHDGVYANASFALHHIQRAEARKQVFTNLKELPVQALVLSEPNSDHYEPNYGKRFRNCVNHYGALFNLIDQLSIADKERAALKLFFGREINDVLGNPEGQRVEKHYATQQWVDLFRETGFQLHKRPVHLPALALNGAHIFTNLPDRYATAFQGEEITSLFWAE